MGKKLPAFVAQWGTLDPPAFYEGQKGWGNHNEPDVYVLDVNPNYPVGTAFYDGEKTYVYGYITIVEGTTTKCGQGLFNIATGKVTTTDAVIEPVGEREIKIEDTASTVNQWAGGYMMSRSHPTYTYRIIASTVHDGEHSILTLERAKGLVTATSSGQTVRLYENQYKTLCSSVNAGRRDVTVMGCAPVVPVASRYGWIQTGGPCNVLGGDEVPGSGNHLRMGMFNIDGTLIWTGDPLWSTTAGGQVAGCVINDTNAASYTASWFIDLQIRRY